MNSTFKKMMLVGGVLLNLPTSSSAEPLWQVACYSSMACELSIAGDFTNGSFGVSISSISDTWTLELLLPLGFDLEYGVFFQIDDLDRVPVMPMFCGAGGCIFRSNLSEDFLQQMRSGQVFNIHFKEIVDQAAPQRLALSLQGSTFLLNKL